MLLTGLDTDRAAAALSPGGCATRAKLVAEKTGHRKRDASLAPELLATATDEKRRVVARPMLL